MTLFKNGISDQKSDKEVLNILRIFKITKINLSKFIMFKNFI